MTRQIESCSICRYYEEFPIDEDDDEPEEDTPTGLCRRYPPTQYPGLVSAYPEVIGSSGWCGEFTPKS